MSSNFHQVFRRILCMDLLSFVVRVIDSTNVFVILHSIILVVILTNSSLCYLFHLPLQFKYSSQPSLLEHGQYTRILFSSVSDKFHICTLQQGKLLTLSFNLYACQQTLQVNLYLVRPDIVAHLFVILKLHLQIYYLQIYLRFIRMQVQGSLCMKVVTEWLTKLRLLKLYSKGNIRINVYEALGE